MRRHLVDALIVAVALESAVAVALAGHGSTAPDSADWFAVPAVALIALPLLARGRRPFAAPALLWLLAASISFIDGRLAVFNGGTLAAGLGAAWLLGNLEDGRQARLGLGVAIGGALIVVYNNPAHDTGQLVFIPVLVAIAWLAGFAMRERSEEAEAAEERARLAERERETTARIAVAEERARIARDLHDVVGHALSVIVLQAGAIRHRQPERAGEDGDALGDIERTGREALTEVRRLVGAMRRDGEEPALAPQPGLARLDPLLDQVRGAGLPVDVHFEGNRRPLPAGVDLSAYRIIQEGLTTTIKHAHAGHADVSLRYGDDDLEIRITDDGDGEEAGATDAGFGLIGIRERVNVYGGEMSAGASPDGGFTLRTRLPLEAGVR
jgi:signal transduction histidine kinase